MLPDMKGTTVAIDPDVRELIQQRTGQLNTTNANLVNIVLRNALADGDYLNALDKAFGFPAPGKRGPKGSGVEGRVVSEAELDAAFTTTRAIEPPVGP